MDQASSAAAAVSKAGYTLIDSGVLGSLVILQFALLALMFWQVVRVLNKNTEAITKFAGVIERLPCLDRDAAESCDHKRKDRES